MLNHSLTRASTLLDAATLNEALGCGGGGGGGTASGDACFSAAYYNPTFFKYNGSVCSGVQWVRYPGDPAGDHQCASTSPMGRARPTASSSSSSSSSSDEDASPSSLIVAANVLRVLQRLSPPGASLVVAVGVCSGGWVSGLVRLGVLARSVRRSFHRQTCFAEQPGLSASVTTRLSKRDHLLHPLANHAGLWAWDGSWFGTPG
jgi:hypothetical protein